MVASMVHCCHPNQVAQVVLRRCIMLLVEKNGEMKKKKLCDKRKITTTINMCG